VDHAKEESSVEISKTSKDQQSLKNQENHFPKEEKKENPEKEKNQKPKFVSEHKKNVSTLDKSIEQDLFKDVHGNNSKKENSSEKEENVASELKNASTKFANSQKENVDLLVGLL
jgi:uncharacterized protein with von Willebrand factor type A (vWA) domain